MKLFIVRKPDNGIETLGDLFLKDAELTVIFTSKTLEPPFKGNKHQISCIPADNYICKKIAASENIPYQHISITNVPGRDGICIHVANFVKELLGCIAVGSTLFDLDKDGNPDITSSKVTFEKLMFLLPEEFELNISYESFV